MMKPFSEVVYDFYDYIITPYYIVFSLTDPFTLIFIILHWLFL
jgi:hypothetical protein